MPARRPAAADALIAWFPPGVPSFAFVRGRYRWPPGGTPVLHLFRDWDIFLVESGQATWTFADGRRAVAGPGELVLLPPLVPATVSQSRAGLIFHFCHFDFRRPAEHPRARAAAFAGPATGTALPLAIRGAPQVADAYRRLARTSDDDARPWRVEAALIALVGAVAEHAADQRTARGDAPRAVPVDPRVQAVARRLEEGPPRAWRVAELAAIAGCSAGRLHALFRAATGHGTRHAIVEARLRRALRLLLERPRASVRTVAEAAGFSSQHFFSRQFRSRFGAAPLAYRRRALAAPG